MFEPSDSWKKTHDDQNVPALYECFLVIQNSDLLFVTDIILDAHPSVLFLHLREQIDVGSAMAIIGDRKSCWTIYQHVTTLIGRHMMEIPPQPHLLGHKVSAVEDLPHLCEVVHGLQNLDPKVPVADPILFLALRRNAGLHLVHAPQALAHVQSLVYLDDKELLPRVLLEGVQHVLSLALLP